MKLPKHGCRVLEALRAYGGKVNTRHCATQEQIEGVELVFKDAFARMTPPETMSFYSPECPVRDGDDMEYLPFRPPYEDVWVETVMPDGTPIGYAVRSGTYPGKEGSYVRILAFWLTDPQGPPRGMASVMYLLDDRGRRTREVGYAPIYGESSDATNQNNNDWIVYPCVKILQRMSVTNIGFYREKDPGENNPRMTHNHRRKLIGRRYHVLVIRDKADIRANRKVVEHKGLMPLHWSRGHYQHNGPASVHGHPDGQDRGLAFGWLAGVCWIQAAAKGDRKNGIVDKDYKFADPADPRRKRRPRTAEQPTTPDSFAAAMDPANRDVQVPQRQEAK